MPRSKGTLNIYYDLLHSSISEQIKEVNKAVEQYLIDEKLK